MRRTTKNTMTEIITGIRRDRIGVAALVDAYRDALRLDVYFKHAVRAFKRHLRLPGVVTGRRGMWVQSCQNGSGNMPRPWFSTRLLEPLGLALR